MDLPSSFQPAAFTAAEDKWEVYNEDGFIYKRQKCRRVLTEPTPLLADPKEDEKLKPERKRQNLLRIKAKYEKEIEEWEILSKTLNAMQDKALGFQIQQRERSELDEVEEKQRTTSYLGLEKKDNASDTLVDELLLQVEAQEMIIRDVSDLCDAAEAMCISHKERSNQAYFDLPIWASPCELMESLCDDECECRGTSMAGIRVICVGNKYLKKK